MDTYETHLKNCADEHNVTASSPGWLTTVDLFVKLKNDATKEFDTLLALSGKTRKRRKLMPGHARRQEQSDQSEANATGE